MTKPKPENIEARFGIHNSPESFYIKIGKIRLHSDSLLKTPTVTVYSVMSVKTANNTTEWMNNHNIPYSEWSELSSIVHKFVGFLSLTTDDRKELFRMYKETQLAKLDLAIKGLKKAEKHIWNDKVKLIKVWNVVLGHIKAYEVVKENLSKRRVGHHQLLYDMLIPLLDKLNEYGYSDHKAQDLINDLLDYFDYHGDNDIGKELLKYLKKPYAPQNLNKQIQKALNS